MLQYEINIFIKIGIVQINLKQITLLRSKVELSHKIFDDINFIFNVNERNCEILFSVHGKNYKIINFDTDLSQILFLINNKVTMATGLRF